MSALQTYRVLMAAGGTGGHVYPAIAIAGAIRATRPGAEITFAGTRSHMEWQAVPKAGYNILPIWISGFHRNLNIQNVLFPIKLIVSLFQSLAIIMRVKPNVVVCCGGYVSGPVGRMAALMGIPLMLQEQNSFPGVTNRILAKKAKYIFTAFPDAASYFPSGKVYLLGNPVRADISNGDRNVAAKDFGLKPEAKTLLIMGGSGGAKAINDAMLKNLGELHDGQQLQIIWQCGKRYFEDLQKRIDMSKFPNLRLVAFLENMPNAYAMSDLVVCRAGAGTMAELSVLGLPAVLVPSPWVAGNHQTKNARSFVQAGAATLLKDDELSEKLSQSVSDLITSPDKLSSMHNASLAMALPNAAQNIAKAILESTQIQTEVPVS